MTTVYLAFYYCPSDVADIHINSRYLGAFPTPEDVIHHMNETSSGNRPFIGTAIKDLTPGTTIACRDFDPIIIFIASVTFTSRTKAIYVSIDPYTETCTVDIRKIKDAIYTIPITNCPMCGTKCVAADDDGHCSYACASGG